jgi:hypothetical protein
MKKFSVEWKLKKGSWIQKHKNHWKIHYIRYNTEYSTGLYITKTQALEALWKGGE